MTIDDPKLNALGYQLLPLATSQWVVIFQESTLLKH